MNIGTLFDWFTKESMNAALQASDWKHREMFLRLALMWGTAAQQAQRKQDNKLGEDRR